MSITFKGTDMSVPISMQKMYSDATPMIKTGEDDWDKIVYDCDTLVLRANSLMEFVNGMFLCDSVTESGGRIEKLILPYLPGARQDRVNPTGDVLFTSLSVAWMINERGFEKVVSLDPHSPVISSNIYDFVEYPLEKVYEKLWNGYTGVIAPDKGAVKRATRAGMVMGKPVAFGSKIRDESTGALTGFSVPEFERGGHYLIVDDICDGGGTFIGLGDKILEQDCHVDLYVTHGIFSKGTDALKKIFKNIYTTDTRDFHERNDVIVIPVVKEMENYNV